MTEQTKPEVANPNLNTPKPHAPSPASFAHKPQLVAKSTVASYGKEDVEQAKAFGRVDEQGNVFVRVGDEERQVGQFLEGNHDEALTFYAHRYLDISIKLDLLAKRLQANSMKPREIDAALAGLANELANPDVVGDIQALRKQLDELQVLGASKKEAFAQARQEALSKALAERTQIVEQAEHLVEQIDEANINWRSVSDKLRALFDKWQHHQQTTIHLNKADADALWQRFSKARSTFNQARNAWLKQRDSARENAKKIKESIIQEAEAIKDSTQWRETSNKFNALMDRWKKAGNVGRQQDDELWARFRKAADVFYQARQADRDKLDADQQENLSKKEALLVKAEALLPVTTQEDAKRARLALSAIQDEWDAIGFVPREAVNRIENRLNEVDKSIKAVEQNVWQQTDPEADARKSSFAMQLQAQLEELDKQIAQTTDENKKRSLEAEKATKEQWLSAIR